MIQIDDLAFDYGSGGFCLSIPDLHIPCGQKVAVVGRSGSGKTTLLQLVAGILRPTRGSVRVGTTAISDLDESLRRKFRISNIGLVFQDFALLDYLTARENIRLPYLLNPVLRWTAECEGTLARLAQSCRLTHLLNRYPSQLSHGEKQRVALCRALIAQPAWILADEPTGSLDVQTAKDVIELLLGQMVAQKSTLLVVTHDLQLADRMDRRIDMAEFQQYTLERNTTATR